MCFHVLLGGVFCVLVRVDVVAVGKVGVMGSRFVVSIFVLLGGFTVMTCSVFVMLRCLVVMVRCFLGHSEFLSSYRCLCGTMNYRELRLERSLQRNKFKMNFRFHIFSSGSALHQLPPNQVQRLLRSPLPHAVAIPAKCPIIRIRLLCVGHREIH